MGKQKILKPNESDSTGGHQKSRYRSLSGGELELTSEEAKHYNRISQLELIGEVEEVLKENNIREVKEVETSDGSEE